MSDALMINGQKLLPIKEVVSRSRYTRDYIAKLAREGQIVGTQVGRQWFIDESSLLSFTEASELESEVRRRHLSSERRRERDLREEVERQWDIIPKQTRYQPLRAVTASVAVFCVAILSGLAVQQVPTAIHHIAALQKTQVVGGGLGMLPEDTSVRERVVVEFPAVTDGTEDASALVFSDIQTSEVLRASSAVLFIPEGAATSASVVAGMFSDPVTVTFNSMGAGLVVGSSSAGTTSIPFVTVPVAVAQEGLTEVMPTTP